VTEYESSDPSNCEEGDISDDSDGDESIFVRLKDEINLELFRQPRANRIARDSKLETRS
jgi:hypothetical protein